jgi:hypothetical protein
VKRLPKARILRKPIPTTTNIPPGEYQLAQLLQNAGAYGLTSCRNAYYRDANGYALRSPIGATCCCASGAARLSPDTDEEACGLYLGNDIGPDSNWGGFWTDDWEHPEHSVRHSVGAAFEIALRP